MARKLPKGVRRLPSGLYQGVVYMPSGKRTTATFPLASMADEWRQDRLAEFRAGSTRDPRAGDVTVEDWHAKWRPAQRWVTSHAERMDGVWKLYVRPQWGGWRLAQITPIEVQRWAVNLDAGPATVRKAVNLLSSMFTDAVHEGLIPANPARLPKGKLPQVPRRPPRWYTHEQASAILRHTDARYVLPFELDFFTGLRWGELAGLRVGSVDTRSRLVHVTSVLERDGTLRPHPKSRLSRRSVPYPAHLADDLAEWIESFEPTELLFVSPNGKPLSYTNTLRRVWQPAVKAAGVPDHGIHAMRHTAASWLTMAGTDLRRVQVLLGHESIETTQSYSHLSPSAFDAVTSAWETITHAARTGTNLQE